MSNSPHVVDRFYTAFAAQDAETMATCYHPEVVFEDPAFGELHGEEAADMWRMLIERGGDTLQVTHQLLEADERHAKANWEAKYQFSKTGRSVHNKIAATFELKDGLIIRHHDHFNFRKWAQMALGPVAGLLAFTPMIQNKVRKTSLKLLQSYRSKRSASK